MKTDRVVHQRHEDFNENIADEGEPIVEHPHTEKFRDMLWMIKTLSETIDLSKRFRIIVDYDPERESMLVKKYYQNGETQEVLRAVKGNTIL